MPTVQQYDRDGGRSANLREGAQSASSSLVEIGLTYLPKSGVVALASLAPRARLYTLLLLSDCLSGSAIPELNFCFVNNGMVATF